MSSSTISPQNLRALVEIEREKRRRARRTAPPPSVVAWAETTAQIVHPARGRIPFRPYPYQRTFLACPDSRRIILKARQIGFSQVFALEALYTAITRPESTILLVSRSQDLAINLLRYCYQTYNNLIAAPALVKENESEIGIENGSRIKSIPANRSTGRGFAATDVYLDEFAYASYAEDIYQSVSPAISQGGRLTIGSTPNGVGNLFHQLYTAGEGFTRFYVPWHHCPMYYTDEERAAGVPKEEAAWYLRERPKYTAQQWAAEYDCSFIGSGLGLFQHTDVEAAHASGVTPTAPIAGHRYLTTVDVGRRHDATVINTVDMSVMPYQRVAFARLEHVPYPLIQQQIEQRARAYPGRLIIESNGPGDPLIENLDVRAEAFVTTVRSKVQALQALQLLLERGELRATWDARERQALVTAAWDDDHTADEVMSLAIAAAFLTHTPARIPPRRPTTSFKD